MGRLDGLNDAVPKCDASLDGLHRGLLNLRLACGIPPYELFEHPHRQWTVLTLVQVYVPLEIVVKGGRLGLDNAHPVEQTTKHLGDDLLAAKGEGGANHMGLAGADERERRPHEGRGGAWHTGGHDEGLGDVVEAIQATRADRRLAS